MINWLCFHSFSCSPPHYWAQGCCEDLEPTEDQDTGCGGEDKEGDSVPEAVQTSTHHQTVRVVIVFYLKQIGLSTPLSDNICLVTDDICFI